MQQETVECTTRSQLKGYGASSYQARRITKDIPVFGKEGNANIYKLDDVIASIREYNQNSRVKESTHSTLQMILNALLERLGNVIEISFEKGTNPELTKLARQLSVAMTNTDKKLAKLRATVASIEGSKKK